jgi:diadenosine tetraphosphate (Ap4A) HIT family hydrolase
MTICPICARGRPLDVIADLPAAWVTAGPRAVLPGYVCVVSKLHVREPYELTGQHRAAFWDDLSTVAEGVAAATAPDKLNYEIHGNTVPHLHVHVYPRFARDPFEGRPIDPWSMEMFERSPAYLQRFVDAIQDRVRATRWAPRSSRQRVVGGR